MRGETGIRSRRPPHRRGEHIEERHKDRESGAETEAEEDEEGNVEEGGRYGETPRGASVEVICVGEAVPPPEENADLRGFTPEFAHLLLKGVYGDFPHHNNKLH